MSGGVADEADPGALVEFDVPVFQILEFSRSMTRQRDYHVPGVLAVITQAGGGSGATSKTGNVLAFLIQAGSP